MHYLIYELDGSIPRFLVLGSFDATVLLACFCLFAIGLVRVGPNDLRSRTLWLRILVASAFTLYYLALRHYLKTNPTLLWIFFPLLWAIVAISPLVSIRRQRRQAAAFLWLAVRATIRRSCCILFAVCGIIAFTLPFLTLSLLLKLASTGPVFVRQRRLRYDGKIVTLVKFRTKVAGESRYHWSPFRSTAITDLRITRIGWWLRITGVYRLPMLWNILRGEIDIFGLTPLMQEHLHDADVSRIVRRNLRAVSQFYCLDNEHDILRAVAMEFPVGLLPFSALYSYHIKPGKQLFIRQLNTRPYVLGESDYIINTRFAVFRLMLRFFTRVLGLVLCLFHILRYQELVNNKAVPRGGEEFAINENS